MSTISRKKLGRKPDAVFHWLLDTPTLITSHSNISSLFVQDDMVNEVR